MDKVLDEVIDGEVVSDDGDDDNDDVIDIPTSRGIMKKSRKDGQWVTGTAPGPGRLPHLAEVKYLKGMHSVVSVDDWQAITLRAVEDALDGKASARNWLSRYLLDPVLKSVAVMGEVKDVVDETGQNKKLIRLVTMLSALLPGMQDE